MSLSDKAIQEFKEIVKKEKGIELSDAEARIDGEQLTAFVELLIDIAKVELRRKERLKKEPEGFSLDENDGTYNCCICYQPISGSLTWWDSNGVRCLDCQRSIKEGVIPAEICQNDGLWVKNWQLKSDYGIHSSTARKLRREGLLHGRDIKRKDGTVYCTVYLMDENQEFLKKYPKKPEANTAFIYSEKNTTQKTC